MIRSPDTGQQIPCFDSCQFNIDVYYHTNVWTVTWQPKFLWSVGYQIFWGMGLRAYRIFGRNVSGQNFFKPFLVVVVLLSAPHQRSDYRHRGHFSCADSAELLLITAWVESKYLRSSTHARSSKGASYLVKLLAKVSMQSWTKREAATKVRTKEKTSVRGTLKWLITGPTKIQGRLLKIRYLKGTCVQCNLWRNLLDFPILGSLSPVLAWQERGSTTGLHLNMSTSCRHVDIIPCLWLVTELLVAT